MAGIDPTNPAARVQRARPVRQTPGKGKVKAQPAQARRAAERARQRQQTPQAQAGAGQATERAVAGADATKAKDFDAAMAKRLGKGPSEPLKRQGGTLKAGKADNNPNDTASVQRALTKLKGPDGKPYLKPGEYTPGKYDQKTADAVKKFQADKKLALKDGEVGTDTTKALNEELKGQNVEGNPNTTPEEQKKADTADIEKARKDAEDDEAGAKKNLDESVEDAKEPQEKYEAGKELTEAKKGKEEADAKKKAAQEEYDKAWADMPSRFNPFGKSATPEQKARLEKAEKGLKDATAASQVADKRAEKAEQGWAKANGGNKNAPAPDLPKLQRQHEQAQRRVQTNTEAHAAAAKRKEEAFNRSVIDQVGTVGP